MHTRHAVLELPAQARSLDDITGDEHHEVVSIALSTVAAEGGWKHFALVVWVDRDTKEHGHVGSTPGRTFDG